MKIKFRPGICIDLIIIELGNIAIWLSFFPAWCWAWEWQVEKCRCFGAYTIETPTMSIAIKLNTNA